MLVQRPRPAASPATTNHEAALPVRPSLTSVNARRDRIDHFARWRPSFHLIAPKNWMNDPCGPCFDERTGLFHVLYQYNPKGATWGNMNWMHATSTDMVHWKHVSQEPSLMPATPQDCEGVFSGAMVPHGPKGEAGMLTAFYTAVSRLPIHFTKPYHWGCEKLAFATSKDGGQTWQRDGSSILVPSPPNEYKGSVVSWRDPFISAWPQMDIHLGLPHDQFLYGLVSGGLHQKSPTAFLYRIEKADMTKWTYISTIADVGLNFALGPSSGDMGRNWEVCNFFDLYSRQYLLMNVEGAGRDLKSRHPMWTRTDFDPSTAGTGTAQLILCKSGKVDHGCLYAATTFWHAPSQRRIMWGWITEDDLAEKRYEQQGWSGCISLPREIVQLTYQNVDTKIANHPLVAPSFNIGPASSGSSSGHRLSTLGFRPAAETLALRVGAKHIDMRHPVSSQNCLPIESRNLEIALDIAIDEKGLRTEDEVGLLICHNAKKTCGTKVIYSNEAVHVVRSASTSDPDVKTSTITAPMPLLRFADGTHEDLQIRLFLDNSVMEIFVNERTAITTRIYCDDETANMVSLFSRSVEGNPSLGAGFAPQHGGECDRAHVVRVQAWVGLQSAMSARSELGQDDVLPHPDGDIARL